jgi:predicted nucleotidyltransferase
MKYKNYLDELLGKKSQIKVLRYLVKFPQPWNVRELSRRIGVTEPNLSKVLKELADAGVLLKKRHGATHVYSLHAGHYLTDKVILPLFTREQKAIDELAVFIRRRIKSEYISIILFGSAARGEERTKSDLDIAFIVDNETAAEKLEQELMDVGIEVLQYFGNQISPYIIKKSDFSKRRGRGEPLARSIAKEGRVLGGRLLSEIL